ncbi:hypothetical protein D9M70_607830 [compost metagenome]
MPPGGAVDQRVPGEFIERARWRQAAAEFGRADGDQVLVEQRRQRALVQTAGQVQHIGIAVTAGIYHLAADGLDGQAQAGVDGVERAQPGQQPAHRQ